MLLKLLDYHAPLARWAVMTVSILTSHPAEAKQEWTCKRDSQIRKIQIVAETYGKPPCKVVYSKPTEKKPDREIAQAKATFPVCETKAEELALKLQNSGWECAREDS